MTFTKKIILLLLTPVFLKAQVSPKPADLHPTKRQQLITQIVAQMVTTANYKTLPLNDSLSGLIYDRYLKTLDQGRNYLTQNDIDLFSKYRNTFDDDLRAGNLQHAFEIYNLYQSRFRELIHHSLIQLKQPFVFSKNETIILDRAKLPYAKDLGELKSNWNKRVKYDLMLLSKTSANQLNNKAQLAKRYQTLLEQNEQLTEQDVFQIFINAVTASVDPHAAYFNPFNASQFDVSLSRSLEGIGATLAFENGFVVIKSLIAGGPAAKTKAIVPEDRILAISQGIGGEFQDVQGWRLDRAIALIRGKKGSVVNLKVLSKSQAETEMPRTVPVIREKVILEDLSAKKEVKEYQTDGRKTKIGIISIPQFYMDFKAYNAGDQNYKSTSRDVSLLIDSLKSLQVDGIVIDLRQNGGGSLTEAIDLTGLFIKTGPVVQVKDVKGNIQVNRDENARLVYDGPLAVLVDRFSASASEIFTAAIQDYGRGIIIGNQTYGKGTVQQDVDLDQTIYNSSYKQQAAALAVEDKSVDKNQKLFGQINITVGKFYRINGRSTQHTGITPDIPLPLQFPKNQYGEDSEPSALPWDTIKATPYTTIGNFSKAVPTLNKRHQDRFKSNGLDQYSAEVLGDYQKAFSQGKSSLNLKKVQMESAVRTKQLWNRNNRLRIAMGLKILGKTELAIPGEDLDFVKREAGQVLSDLILTSVSTPIRVGAR